MTTGWSLLASGCGGVSDPLPPEEDRIECALSGAREFVRDCWVETAKDGETIRLTIRQPDGGFRRLEMSGDGRDLQTADGADKAQITSHGASVEIAIGADRYRLPKTIGSHAAE